MKRSELKQIIREVIEESTTVTPMTTIANPKAFIEDVFKAFGNTKDRTLNINVTLKGTNVLEYTIEQVNKN